MTWSDFDASVLTDAVVLWAPNLLAATLTGLVLLAVHVGLVRTARFVMQRAGVDETAIQFLLTVERYGIGAIAGVTVLGQLGVDVTSIVASLGIVGLTLGFAARDVLSNIIAGLFIFWDRPFVIGDLVDIDGHYGRVDQITMRSTRVVTVDGRMLAVPNANIVNATVASYTNFPNLRLAVEITVAPDEDLSHIRGLFLDLVEGDERYLATPAAHMVVAAVNDYNLALEFRVWLKDETRHVSERFALREALYTTLTAAQVNMPVETLAVELRQ